MVKQSFEDDREMNVFTQSCDLVLFHGQEN